MHWSIDTSINISINTSINPSIHQLNHPLINWSIEPSMHQINQLIDQSIHRFLNPSIHRSFDPSIHPYIHRLFNPSIHLSIKWSIDALVTHFVILIVKKWIAKYCFYILLLPFLFNFLCFYFKLYYASLKIIRILENKY